MVSRAFQGMQVWFPSLLHCGGWRCLLHSRLVVYVWDREVIRPEPGAVSEAWQRGQRRTGQQGEADASGAEMRSKRGGSRPRALAGGLAAQGLARSSGREEATAPPLSSPAAGSRAEGPLAWGRAVQRAGRPGQAEGAREDAGGRGPGPVRSRAGLGGGGTAAQR